MAFLAERSLHIFASGFYHIFLENEKFSMEVSGDFLK